MLARPTVQELKKLWEPDITPLPSFQRWPLAALRHVSYVIHRLVGGELNLRAMSLVYTTILSLVPLLAFSFSVLKGFGVQNQFEPLLLEYLHALGPEKSVEITNNIVGFVDNIDVRVLGAAGLGVLIYTLLTLIHKIESSLNFVWKVVDQRSLAKRTSTFVSVLTIGPVLLFALLALASSVMSNEIIAAITATRPVGTMVDAASQLWPFVLVSAAFCFLYALVPNTPVRFVPAAVGGLTAGVLWQAGSSLFSQFVSTASSYEAIYVTFGTALLFMIWLYVSWMILLIGATVAYHTQNANRVVDELRNLKFNSTDLTSAALSVLAELSQDIQAGAGATTQIELGRRLQLGDDAMQQVLDLLYRQGLIDRLDHDAPAWVLLVPPEHTLLSDLYLQLETHQPNSSQAVPVQIHAGVRNLQTKLRELRDCELGARTLASLLPALLCSPFALGGFAALALGSPSTALAAESPPEVWVVPIKGPIGPASSDFFARSLSTAQTAGAEAVVMTLDTPGGLDVAMRDMIKTILASDVPVIAYVTPQGARAASAGTYLLYASHVAAMSPATNMGSSTPVSLGAPLPLPKPGATPSPRPIDPTQQPDNELKDQSDMQRKVINDAAAYIRGLADLRERNADWAESSVRDGANLSATEALEQNVVDVIANSTTQLLTQVDGREVTMKDGSSRALHTTNANVIAVAPDWRHQFLNTITNPNVAYLLLMLGLYGLILEFYAPGLGAPGIVGVVCLLLGAYALQMLPINYVGLGLIAFGIMLMVAEAMAPSIGVLGLGGVIAFFTGSVILFDSELPGFRVSLYLIGALAGTSAAIFLFALGAIAKARRQPVVSGSEALVGSTAVALTDINGHGKIHVHGEDWNAQADHTTANHKIRAGDEVCVVAINGLTLNVSPKE